MRLCFNITHSFCLLFFFKVWVCKGEPAEARDGTLGCYTGPLGTFSGSFPWHMNTAYSLASESPSATTRGVALQCSAQVVLAVQICRLATHSSREAFLPVALSLDGKR